MKWLLAKKIDSTTRKQLSEYSKIEAQLLFNRGINSNIEAKKYLNTSIINLNNPKELFGALIASKEIIKAIVNKEKIAIYGDYDVDGICATSLLFDYLFRELKANIIPYVPNRFEEGYGLNEQGIKNLLDLKVNLIITVDCGIRDSKLISKYSKKGLKIIVTDHHSIPIKKDKLDIPKSALCVVHPLLNKNSDNVGICATTVVWKMLHLIQEEAILKKLINNNIDLNKYLDLVALATVCDIMPLKDENRVIVSEGLKLINENKYNEGLKELSKIANVSYENFDTYHFGFIIGPRLNAAGRIEHALEGVRLLTSKNGENIKNIANKLNDLNYKRQGITKKMLDEASLEAFKQVSEGKKLIFVAKDNWNEGVVGLVASKLNEKYHLPVLVANLKEGIVKGSARSIRGFDITNAISQNIDILQKFGGHNQAAGFTLKEENFNKFKDNIQDYALKNITDEMLLKQLKIDIEIDISEANENLIRIINKFKPFGYGNSEPLIQFNNAKIYGTPIAMGYDKRHLKFSVIDSNNNIVNVIGFNMIDKIDTIKSGFKYCLVGNLEENNWNGDKTIQINLKDLKVNDKKD